MFDLDGVLIDSETVWRDVETEVAAELGFDYDDALAEAMHGTGVARTIELIAERTGDPGLGRRAVDMMFAAMRARGERGEIPPMPGARELAAALRGRVSLAVASNSPREYVGAMLGSAGLGPFDVVVAGDEVDRPKPAPDVYLSVAIEDSPPGIASARAAGMRVVALLGMVELEPLEGVPAVASLSELSVETLLEPTPQ